MNKDRVLAAFKNEFNIDARKYISSVVSSILPRTAFNRTRTALLRTVGVRIRAHSRVMGPVHMTGEGSPSLWSIGEHSMITGPIQVDIGDQIIIGNRVHIGHGVLLLTQSHEVGGPEERCGPLVHAPITIEDGVWLGARVTVCPGVTIGKGTYVAAGSIVTKNLPSNVMAAGVPARIKKLNPPASSNNTDHSITTQVHDA